MQRADHSMIYLAIAGTLAPMAVAGRGTGRVVLLLVAQYLARGLWAVRHATASPARHVRVADPPPGRRGDAAGGCGARDPRVARP